MNRIIKRLAVPLSAAAVLGTAGFAYMASNTVPETFAGEGSHSISGYTILDYRYNVGSSQVPPPTVINSVTIQLDHPAHQALLYITDYSGQVHSYGCLAVSDMNGSGASGGGPWSFFQCSSNGAPGQTGPGGFFGRTYTKDAATLTVEANM